MYGLALTAECSVCGTIQIAVLPDYSGPLTLHKTRRSKLIAFQVIALNVDKLEDATIPLRRLRKFVSLFFNDFNNV